MQTVIITGLSGAGKSQAMEGLEDQGYYCIDNMPPALIADFINLAMTPESGIERAAFVVDIRGGEIFGGFQEAMEVMDAYSIDVKVLFLEATTDTLLRRFDATRRVHPVTHRAATEEAIEAEREKLKFLRNAADFVIDTSGMKTAQLKEEIREILEDRTKEETFVINIMSFGFKYGIPVTADMVFDMRFIPNPFYVPTLKRLTGNNKKIRDYVGKYYVTQSFVKNLDRLINGTIPGYMQEGKWHLNVAFGCTGGHHRSVAMANEFYERFKRQGKQVTLEHRDIKKG
ncbi:MAG: RNase adapter RapZ [Clostridiales bacterium]|nr:RNase adapter RapZ [Clostridiales bacterium]